MRLMKRLFCVIAVIIALAGIVFADSNGIVFNWQPFIVNDYLALNQPWGNMPLKEKTIYQEMFRQFNDIDELLQSDLKIINNISEVTTKKSVLNNIKITFSSGNSFMMPSDEIYLRGKDGKLSQASKTLPSFFRNPSQEMAVETLKIIEPQVNLGFEF
jgi:hypothetical protein